MVPFSFKPSQMNSTRIVELLGAGLLAAALLLPVGDLPWFSFWREWTASLAVLLMLLGALSRLRQQARPLAIVWPGLPATALLLALVALLQWAAGLVPYRGDAVLVAAALAGFALCMAMAQSLAAAERTALADRLAAALLSAAAVSALIAIGQWAGWVKLEMGLSLAAGRPVAHMEQANLLSSLCVLGALAAWRLYERARLGRWPGALLVALLLAAIVLTQSRAAFLALLAVWAAFAGTHRRLPGLVARLPALAVASVVLTAGALLLPLLDSQLHIAGTSLEERSAAGRRPQLWQMMLEAIAQRPLAGWGVLGNGAAQFSVADHHPSLKWFFSSAHDLPLDLMLWFGVPLGMIATAALGGAVLRRVLHAADLPALATALSAAALLTHAMVEFPLHYLYFLLPMGLMLGTSGGDDSGQVLRLPLRSAAVLPLMALLPTLLLALLAHDYTRLCDVRPTVEYDDQTSHFVLGAQPPAPEVVVLDQLAAFHAFAATPMKEGLSPTALDGLRPPMLRLPYPAAIERYAHAMALNGRREPAREALLRLCKFATVPQCDASERAWSFWQELGQPLTEWPDAAGH